MRGEGWRGKYVGGEGWRGKYVRGEGWRVMSLSIPLGGGSASSGG